MMAHIYPSDAKAAGLSTFQAQSEPYSGFQISLDNRVKPNRVPVMVVVE